MDQYSEQHLLSQEVMETIVQIQEVTSDIDLSLEDADQTARDLNRTAKQLQTSLTQVRMRPLSDIVGRFPRALRELAREYGKVAELKIYGGATLIDRAILETLSDPLMHLFRNCFDHGLETPEVRRAAGKPEQGTIEIRAAYRGNRTIITMGDDGGGINIEKIRAKAQTMGMDPKVLATATERELLELIFEPGFSTASQVTALSGRGVGMDVVRTNLKQVRGDIRVDTKLGVGSTFTISVPFTLSVVRVLLVESNGMLLAFPKDVIEEMLLPEAGQIFTTAGNEFLNWDGFMVPLVHLNRWLAFNCPFRSSEVEDSPIINAPTVLMISQGNELTGIRIDRCWGEQEVAVRQVEGSIPLPIGFAGCTILGNGRVVPLVDTATLLTWIMDTGTAPTANRLTQSGLSPASVEAVEDTPMMIPAIAQPQQDTILVVDDSINVRRFLKLTLQKAGYRVEEAKDGQDALEKLIGGLQVEAVICDIEMPRLDGYGFLARIKAESTFKNLPVAMLTSRSGNKHRQLAMSLGATAYFSQPYKEQDLLKTLEQLIQSQSLVPTF
ncbi:MAG: hybrid sensor histidine kinase/response regulator, partial [Leptolyngbyaceae bacterium]|nr:hybrid sensor histidine kinase/response regulator [Leptolyngbyaceae bacterium]